MTQTAKTISRRSVTTGLAAAAGLPVLTTASAVAVISLFVDDPALVQHCVYGDDVRALVEGARDYIASTA